MMRNLSEAAIEDKMMEMPARGLRFFNISQSGQTAVFVFILLLVGLTIGLSLSTRTVKDLQGSVGSDLSSRAFAAAEAGVEDALRQDLATISDGIAHTGSFSENNTNYSYTVLKTNTVSQTILQDNAVQLDLTNGGSNFTGVLSIYWVRVTDTVENSAGSRPSMELTFIKNVGGAMSVVKYGVNSEPRSNGFQQADDSTQGAVKNFLPNYSGGQATDPSYANLTTINIAAADNYVALRIRPLYNKNSIRVSGPNLPTNTFIITSTGTAANSVTRVVQVNRTVPALPPIFDYVLFNGSTQPLSK